MRAHIATDGAGAEATPLAAAEPRRGKQQRLQPTHHNAHNNSINQNVPLANTYHHGAMPPPLSNGKNNKKNVYIQLLSI